MLYLLFRPSQLWRDIIFTYQFLSLSRTGIIVSSVLYNAASKDSCVKNFVSVLNGNNIRMSAKDSYDKRSLPEMLSVHTANITEVHNVPMKILIRPIPSVLDEDKVISLMTTIQDPETENSVPPIDIMWIKGRQGGNYYYSFGGCHRYEAYKRLNREMIPCKLFKSSVENLKPYLGGSTPDLL